MNDTNMSAEPMRERASHPRATTLILGVVVISASLAQTVTTGVIDLGEVPDYSWYGQYLSREKISDPIDLHAPSQNQVDSWKKKFLSFPLPPRYKKPLQTKDDHDVWNRVSSEYKYLLSFREELEVAYIEYRRYGLDVAKINSVCGQISAATQVRAWKDIWERTTRVRKQAGADLGKITHSVEVAVDKLFEPLVAIKQKEYDAWARKHPQEAMAIAVKNVQAKKQKVIEEVFSVGNGQVTYINPETGALRTENLPKLSHRQRKDNIRACQFTYEFQQQKYIDEHPEDPDALHFISPAHIDRESGVIVAP